MTGKTIPEKPYPYPRIRYLPQAWEAYYLFSFSLSGSGSRRTYRIAGSRYGFSGVVFSPTAERVGSATFLQETKGGAAAMSKRNRDKRKRQGLPRYAGAVIGVGLEALDTGKLKPGVYVIPVRHDGWCDLLAGKGPCNCDPEVRPPKMCPHILPHSTANFHQVT
jgi:hypothetical protein